MRFATAQRRRQEWVQWFLCIDVCLRSSLYMTTFNVQIYYWPISNFNPNHFIYLSTNKTIQPTIKSFDNSFLHLNTCIHVKNLQHHSFMLNICVSHLHQNYIKGRIQIASYIKMVLFSFYLLSKLYGHMIMLIIQYFCYNKSI